MLQILTFLWKLKRKSTFSILNNLYAVLNLSRLMTNVHGSAKKHAFYSSSPLPSYHRSSEQSIPNLLSVEQKQLVPTFSRRVGHSEILLQSLHKIPVSPYISLGSPPPSGKPMTSALLPFKMALSVLWIKVLGEQTDEFCWIKRGPNCCRHFEQYSAARQHFQDVKWPKRFCLNGFQREG